MNDSPTLPEIRTFLAVNRELCDFSQLNRDLTGPATLLPPEIFPSIRKPAHLHSNATTFETTFNITSSNLQVDDRVKLVGPVQTRRRVTQVPSSNTFSVTDIDELPPGNYEVYGIEIHDPDRIGLCNYTNLSGNSQVIIPGSAAYLNFNPTLYKLLYPDTRTLTDEQAFVDYATRIPGAIGNLQELLASKDGAVSPALRLPDRAQFDQLRITDILALPCNVPHSSQALDLSYVTDTASRQPLSNEQGLMTERAIRMHVHEMTHADRSNLRVTERLDIPFSNVFAVPHHLSASSLEVSDQIQVPDAFYNQFWEWHGSNLSLSNLTLPSPEALIYLNPPPAEHTWSNAVTVCNAPVTLCNAPLTLSACNLNLLDRSPLRIDETLPIEADVVFKPGARLDVSRLDDLILDPQKYTFLTAPSNIFCNQVVITDAARTRFDLAPGSAVRIDRLHVPDQLHLPPDYLQRLASNIQGHGTGIGGSLFIPALTTCNLNFPYNQLVYTLESHNNWEFVYPVSVPDLNVRSGKIYSATDTLDFEDQVTFSKPPRFPDARLNLYHLDIGGAPDSRATIEQGAELKLAPYSYLTIDHDCSFKIYARPYFFTPPAFETEVQFGHPVTFSSNVTFTQAPIIQDHVYLPSNLVLESPCNLIYKNPPPPPPSGPVTFTEPVFFSNAVILGETVCNWPRPEPDSNPVFNTVSLRKLIPTQGQLDLSSNALHVQDLTAREATLACNLSVPKIQTDQFDVPASTIEDLARRMPDFRPRIACCNLEVLSNAYISGQARFESNVTFAQMPTVEAPFLLPSDTVFPPVCDLTGSLVKLGAWQTTGPEFWLPSNIERIVIGPDQAFEIRTSNLTFSHPLDLRSHGLRTRADRFQLDLLDPNSNPIIPEVRLPEGIPLELEDTLHGRDGVFAGDIICSNLNASQDLTVSGTLKPAQLDLSQLPEGLRTDQAAFGTLSASNASFSSVDLPPQVTINDLTITGTLNMLEQLQINSIKTASSSNDESHVDRSYATFQYAQTLSALECDIDKVRTHKLTVNSNLVLPDPLDLASTLYARDVNLSNLSVAAHAEFANAHFYASTHADSAFTNARVSNLWAESLNACNIVMQNFDVEGQARLGNILTCNLESSTLFADLARYQTGEIDALFVKHAHLSNLDTEYVAVSNLEAASNTVQQLQTNQVNVDDLAQIKHLSNDALTVKQTAIVEGELVAPGRFLSASNALKDAAVSNIEVRNTLRTVPEAQTVFRGDVGLEGSNVDVSAPKTNFQGDLTRFSGPVTEFASPATAFVSNVSFEGPATHLDAGNVSITGPHNRAANLELTNISLGGPNIAFTSTPTFQQDARVQRKVITPFVSIGPSSVNPVGVQQPQIDMSHTISLNDITRTKVMRIPREREQGPALRLEIRSYPHAVIQTDPDDDTRMILRLSDAPFALDMLGTRGEIVIQEKSMHGRTCDLAVAFSPTLTVPIQSLVTYGAPSKAKSYTLSALRYVVVAPEAIAATIEKIAEYIPPASSDEYAFAATTYSFAQGLIAVSAYTTTVYALARDTDESITLPDGSVSSSELERAFLSVGEEIIRLAFIGGAGDVHPEIMRTEDGEYIWSCALPPAPAKIQVVARDQTILGEFEGRTDETTRIYVEGTDASMHTLGFVPIQGDLPPRGQVSPLQSQIVFRDGNDLRIVSDVRNWTETVYSSAASLAETPWPRVPGICFINDGYTQVHLADLGSTITMREGVCVKLGDSARINHSQDLLLGLTVSRDAQVEMRDPEGITDLTRLDIPDFCQGAQSLVVKYNKRGYAKWFIEGLFAAGATCAPEMVSLPDGDIFILWQGNDLRQLRDAWQNVYAPEQAATAALVRITGLGEFATVFWLTGTHEVHMQRTNEDHIALAIQAKNQQDVVIKNEQTQKTYTLQGAASYVLVDSFRT